jgi:hypothetical protein
MKHVLHSLEWSLGRKISARLTLQSAQGEGAIFSDLWCRGFEAKSVGGLRGEKIDYESFVHVVWGNFGRDLSDSQFAERRGQNYKEMLRRIYAFLDTACGFR